MLQTTMDNIWPSFIFGWTCFLCLIHWIYLKKTRETETFMSVCSINADRIWFSRFYHGLHPYSDIKSLLLHSRQSYPALSHWHYIIIFAQFFFDNVKSFSVITSTFWQWQPHWIQVVEFILTWIQFWLLTWWKISAVWTSGVVAWEHAAIGNNGPSSAWCWTDRAFGKSLISTFCRSICWVSPFIHFFL